MAHQPTHPPVTHGPPYTPGDLRQAQAYLRWLIDGEEGDSGNNPRSGAHARERAQFQVEVIAYWLTYGPAAAAKDRP